MKFASIFSTALLALSMGISAQGQALVNGTYQFVSTVTDPNGNRLALTDQGPNQAIIATQLFFGQQNQTWTVQNSSLGVGFNIFSPSSNINGNGQLQVGPLGNLPGPLSTISTATGTLTWLSTFIPGVGFTFNDTLQGLGTTIWTLNGSTASSSLNSLTLPPTNPLSAFVAIRIT